MRVRLRTRWRLAGCPASQPGDVLEVDEVVARRLVHRGYGVILDRLDATTAGPKPAGKAKGSTRRADGNRTVGGGRSSPKAWRGATPLDTTTG